MAFPCLKCVCVCVCVCLCVCVCVWRGDHTNPLRIRHWIGPPGWVLSIFSSYEGLGPASTVYQKKILRILLASPSLREISGGFRPDKIPGGQTEIQTVGGGGVQ